MDLRYLKQAILYFITALISIVLIFYVSYHLFDGFAETVTTVAAERVTRHETLTQDGYILRKEQILYASGAGEVGFLYGDGDKVASGAELGQVYAVSSPAVREKIMELDAQIALYEAANAVAGVTVSDTGVIDRRIERLYLLLKNAQLTGDSEYICRKQRELLILLNQRKILTGSVDSFDREIEALQKEKRALTASLSGISGTLYSPCAGIFYAGLDGYEGIFDSSVLDMMTVEDFRAMIDRSPEIGEGGGNGYAVGKIVTDYKWQVACEISLDDARDYVKGRSYSVLFPYNGDLELEMELRSITLSPASNSAVLVFETGTSPENFHYLRMQSVSLVKRTYTGYRVPISAVRMVNGVQGVYVLDGNYVRFRAISPLWEDGGYLIVEEEEALDAREDGIAWLGMYENIITEGKDLYDGKIIK